MGRGSAYNSPVAVVSYGPSGSPKLGSDSLVGLVGNHASPGERDSEVAPRSFRKLAYGGFPEEFAKDPWEKAETSLWV